MATVVFTAMDTDGNRQIGCSEFIQACTNDGEISLHKMADFFSAKQPKQFLRRIFDDTDQRAHVANSRLTTQTFESLGNIDASAEIDIDFPFRDDSDRKSNTEMSCVSREDMKDMPPSIS